MFNVKGESTRQIDIPCRHRHQLMNSFELWVELFGMTEQIDPDFFNLLDPCNILESPDEITPNVAAVPKLFPKELCAKDGLLLSKVRKSSMIKHNPEICKT